MTSIMPRVFVRADGEKIVLGDCSECRDSEHEDFDDSIRLTVVRDPETNKIVFRGHLCGCHRDIRESDGYVLYDKGPKRRTG